MTDPESAITFIQQHLVDNSPCITEYQNVLNELQESKAIIEALKRQLDGKPDMPTDDSGQAQLEKLHNDPNCKSLLKLHLTVEMLETLKDRKTASGKTLLNCINAGLQHPNSSVGVYAADHDAYVKPSFAKDKIKGEKNFTRSTPRKWFIT